MGNSPMSISSIQLSSPLPSPSATPNRQNASHQHSQQALQQPSIETTTTITTNTINTTTTIQDSQSTQNTVLLPPLVFNPPMQSHISIYPLAETPTPPELKRIKFSIDNQPTLLQEVETKDSFLLDTHHETTYSTGHNFKNLSTNTDHSQRKRPAPDHLGNTRTIFHDDWSPPHKKLNDSSTPIVDTIHLTTESNDITPASLTDTNATSATTTNPSANTSNSSPAQPLTSWLPEFAAHLPSTDTMEQTMDDSPNSALPSPVSDLDPNDENWLPTSQHSSSSSFESPIITSHPHSTNPTMATTATTTTTTSSSSTMESTTMMDIVNEDEMDEDTDDGISSLLRTYDTLPSNIQEYLMFQLLRRSTMPSLRFASDMIMEAMKMDFIAHLPRRISQRIFLYLDVRSLCRATGVSKLWKRAIEENSDLWRAKIVQAGFTVTATEIEYYGLLPTHLYHQQVSSSSASSSSASSSSSSTSSSSSATAAVSASSKSTTTRTSNNLATSPFLSPIKEMTHDSLGVDFLDQPLFDTSLLNASDDPTLLYRRSFAMPDYDNIPDPDHPFTPDMESTIHPFKRIYKKHHIMRQNWKHNRVKRQQVSGHGDVVTCLQFDDDKIITGFDDNCINIHDIKTGQLRRVLHGHEGGVWALQYVGNTLVTGSTDRTLRIWDIERGICRFVFRGHSSTVRCLHIVMPTAISTGPGKDDFVMQPSQPLIVSGSRDSTLRVWKLPYLPARSSYNQHQSTQQQQQLQQQSLQQSSIQSRSSSQYLNNDDSFIFDGRQSKGPMMDEDDIDNITQPQSFASSHPFASGILPTTEASFQPPLQQQQQQTSSSSTSQHYHQYQQSQEHYFNPFFLYLLRGHQHSVRALAAHGNTLASGSYDNSVKLWNLEDGELIHDLKGHTQKVYSVVIDAQRQRCISGSMDSTIRVWNMVTGQCDMVLRGHTILVGLLGFTERYLVSAAADASLRIWSVDSDECHHILVGHKGAITSFQHDDHKVISGSEGGLKMWDIRTGKLVRDLISDVNGVWRVAFDERRCVAAVKSDNTTRLEILDYGTDTEEDDC